MESAIWLRNKANSLVYKQILKRIFFMFDPELMHVTFVELGKILGKYSITKKIINLMYNYRNPVLRQRLAGIEFPNPVGVAAGFDKSAQIISIIEDVGFGFEEAGSVTARPHDGNVGKRLERVIPKKSLWVNFGLNNKGVNEISKRLQGKKYRIPYGISVAKTNCMETANDKVGLKDYIHTLNKLNSMNIGSFYVLNISCPNAFGGQPFSRPEAYAALLKQVSKLKITKPIFVKLSPDLSDKEINKIISISNKHKIAGFIISNLTKKHDRNKGGMSGKYLEARANEMLRYVYQKTRGKYILVGVGGIFSASDAYKKIKLGASLVQLITGMIYEGPNLISEINQGLVDLLHRDGYRNIREAVGKDVNLPKGF
jgi:dihydroorotate dehydrogenase